MRARPGGADKTPDVRAAAFLALVMGVLLLAGGPALGVRERSQKRLAVDHTLTNRVEQDANRLEAYFERARSSMLITAHNPAFRDFYAKNGARLAKVKTRGVEIRQAEAALNYLERLYPSSIGEACFIDRSGPENARYVRGVRATLDDLSPDESGNPFFRPTFALRAGEVYQATPYVSPDTREWVIANATPVPGTGFPAAAMVHFEITVESFRREAAALAGRLEILIVDARTGTVVVDSRYQQRVGAPLGRPADRRFVSLGAGVGRGTVTLDDHRAAFRRLKRAPTNANDWTVVAVDPKRAGSILGDAGVAPVGMSAAGPLLLLFAGINLRASRRALHEAAHTDVLTGLGNRRQLLVDLDEACRRADESHRFALVLFDLDGFKNYNDSFGHLPGDALLRRLGQKLAAGVEGWGRAYRLGGDEFCVLAPLRGRERADGVAAMGADALSEEGEGFVIGASYGTVLLPDEAGSASDLLATADLRMYASKQKGRPSAARQTTDVLVRVQEERSPLLGPHVSEVAAIAEAVGERLGLPEQRLLRLRQTAELHDVGKMAIPDEVLDKPGLLTEDEWRLIREHTIVGERIVSAAPALGQVAKLVRATHEHFDGAGYPDGLVGEQIPLEARIVHTADAFCAMTQQRPYRAAKSVEGALDELRRRAGSQFDPKVSEALIAVVREGAFARTSADGVAVDRQ
jgi:diguanylate cyclase (GGDEF)-like protein